MNQRTTTSQCEIISDVNALLAAAPAAVNSFFPGHWALMSRLEDEAQSVLANEGMDATIAFLVDVTFLKQPYMIDRSIVYERLRKHPTEISDAISALRRVKEFDYQAMNVLARVPWFGVNGGRSFNSAVMRLVCPEAFGIIDWRNLAVIMGAPGFEGLIEPVVRFSEFTGAEVLEAKGHLLLTQQVYERYNGVLRHLSRRYGKKVAEIDLILWAYSIDRHPFLRTAAPKGGEGISISEVDRTLLHNDHDSVATRIAQATVANLKDLGPLSRKRVTEELRKIFLFVRDECESFGRKKRGRIREKVNQVVRALETDIAKRDQQSLLSQWSRWQSKLDTASPEWIGIDLPTNMVLEDYFVLEDFLPVKKYLEGLYDPRTLEPRVNLD